MMCYYSNICIERRGRKRGGEREREMGEGRGEKENCTSVELQIFNLINKVSKNPHTDAVKFTHDTFVSTGSTVCIYTVYVTT